MVERPPYGSAVHAAQEALEMSSLTHEGWIAGVDPDRVAQVVVDGLRERGFTISIGPRCDCGWTGEGNHYHDHRMGQKPADNDSAGTLSTGSDPSENTAYKQGEDHG